MLKFFISLLFLFSFLILPLGNVHAVENFNQPIVYILEIDGDIKAGASVSIRSAIDLAEKNRADYLVIKLNTPGGLLMPTKEIADAIIATDLDIIVFINKETGWAFSAGTFILMAADYAVVHPAASIGAAQPVPADEKIIEAMATWMNSLASVNNRDGDMAERFVRENWTLTGAEASKYKIIDATAPNLDQLFKALKIENPDIRIIEISFLEKLLNFLSNPFLMGLFLMLGTLGLVMAFRTGELCITGFISILFLALGAWGMGMIDVSLLGIILIVLGLIMLLIEVFAEPGFGLLGIVGTGIAIFGIFSIEKEPFFEFDIMDPAAMIILGAALTICILFIIVGKMTAKTLRAKPKTGKEILVGQKVVALKDFDPNGVIKVEGLKWTAKEIDDKEVKKGDSLEIIKVEGNTVFVKSKGINPK